MSANFFEILVQWAIKGGVTGGGCFYSLTVTLELMALRRTVAMCLQCYITVTAVTDQADKRQKIENLQIYKFCPCKPKPKQKDNSNTKSQQREVEGKRGTRVAKPGRSFSWK
jgi:hypothetical protein